MAEVFYFFQAVVCKPDSDWTVGARPVRARSSSSGRRCVSYLSSSSSSTGRNTITVLFTWTPFSSAGFKFSRDLRIYSVSHLPRPPPPLSVTVQLSQCVCFICCVFSEKHMAHEFGAEPGDAVEGSGLCSPCSVSHRSPHWNGSLHYFYKSHIVCSKYIFLQNR